MGLFDSFRQETFPTMNPQQAIMTIVLGAVAADGEVSDDEIRRIQGMCALSPLFASNSVEEDLGIMRFAGRALTQHGEEAVSKAIEVLSPELRETAFAFACDMVLADGVLTPTEERFMTDLAKRLELRDNVPESIIFTTIVRNRGVF